MAQTATAQLLATMAEIGQLLGRLQGGPPQPGTWIDEQLDFARANRLQTLAALKGIAWQLQCEATGYDPAHEAPAFRLGVYRHYKGPLYAVHGLSHDANFGSRLVVAYDPLYQRDDKSGPPLAARSYHDFYDPIPDRMRPGTTYARFTFQGPLWPFEPGRI